MRSGGCFGKRVFRYPIPSAICTCAPICGPDRGHADGRSPRSGLAKRGGPRSDLLGRNGMEPAGPELASTISNAGACGMVGLSGTPPAEVRPGIQKTRALTDKPFGVNVILARLQERRSKPALRKECRGDRSPRRKRPRRRGWTVSLCRGSRPASQSTLSLLTLLQAVVGKTPMTLAIPFIFT
jgi:Nitronate monooxygenase